MNDASLDQVRAFWNARPCNVRHSPKPFGTSEYFEEVERRKYFVEPHIPRFAEFERWSGKRILEIGCGIGTDTMSFARAGGSVTAVDLSDRSLVIARRRAEILKLEDRIRFAEGDAEELTRFVPVEPYDLIYSFGVIHHSPSPDRILAQTTAYAVPGTVLKLMVYNLRSWKVLGILLTHARGRFWRLREAVARHSEAQLGCPVTHAFTRAEVESLVKRHGYRNVRTRTEHIFPYRVSDYVAYRYVKEWYFRHLPGPWFARLESRLGWHLCVTAER